MKINVALLWWLTEGNHNCGKILLSLSLATLNSTLRTITDHHGQEDQETDKGPLDLGALENLAEVTGHPSLIHSAFESGNKLGTAYGAQRDHTA